MIRIPFPQCVILTTLDFAQITDRLESAIYEGETQSLTSGHLVPAALPSADSAVTLPSTESHSLVKVIPKQQHFIGEIQGFKFSAARIIGHKYLHLPRFLVPAIEGKINSLYHGYQLTLCIKIHQITLILLLTWLGGLFTITSSIINNIVAGIDLGRFLIPLEYAALAYILVLGYLYFEAWRSTKFFRNLFVRGFAGATSTPVVSPSVWSSELQLSEMGTSQSSTDWLRKNLPSFPHSGKMPSE
ncbi:hypothetical protein [Chamaesiphon minutus]|uniref:Uncharacterized protein n=1 Tax=Chamaesiphon minutus (strain ATCC 27169 / PCC 6605) TaxID=1173020 RepID=K9UHT1_CHAP6|nr:hypothetical protein [Chamaesiphon minutus]AFY94208.1 hypothetical protein Cha6605_3196 [Chamaesiphon minutus PCC 6605]